MSAAIFALCAGILAAAASVLAAVTAYKARKIAQKAVAHEIMTAGLFENIYANIKKATDIAISAASRAAKAADMADKVDNRCNGLTIRISTLQKHNNLK